MSWSFFSSWRSSTESQQLSRCLCWIPLSSKVKMTLDFGYASQLILECLVRWHPLKLINWKCRRWNETKALRLISSISTTTSIPFSIPTLFWSQVVHISSYIIILYYTNHRSQVVHSKISELILAIEVSEAIISDSKSSQPAALLTFSLFALINSANTGRPKLHQRAFCLQGKPSSPQR